MTSVLSIFGITNTAFMTSDILYMTSHPFFRTSHHFMYDIKSTVSDLTSTVSVSSHPPYRWHHSHYMDGITSSISVISYPLFFWHPLSMTSQHSVLMSPHSAYVWHTLHCRWHHIHSITPNHSIYDITSTSGMTSHLLYQTLHPLYLCHHNRSTDITPTFVWHHTHLLCDIIYTIYNITSNPYVITLRCLWHHGLYIWNYIQYVGQHIHYTWDITSTICALTSTV